MDHMGPDEFDDNDRFGDVSDFASESDAQGSDSEASSTDMPSSEATSDYASKRSRKRKSKGKDKRGDNPPSKRRQKPQEEEPLEDPGSLNFLSQTNMLCQSFHWKKSVWIMSLHIEFQNSPRPRTGYAYPTWGGDWKRRDHAGADSSNRFHPLENWYPVGKDEHRCGKGVSWWFVIPILSTGMVSMFEYLTWSDSCI